MNKKLWIVPALLALVLVAGLSACNDDQIKARAVRERIAIDSGQADSYIYNGRNLQFYTDEHSTTSGLIDAAGGWQIVAPTAQTTATPALLINNAGVGNAIEVQDGGSAVWSVNGSGNVAQTGDQAVTGAWKLTGPTAAVTATPVARIGAASDVNDLLVVEKDATVVVRVGNGGLLDVGGGTGGTADGNGDLLVAGDAEVDDTLDVDGDIDLDGDGFDVNITAGFSIDGDAASNITTNTGDLTIENEDKSIIIKGDEAAADAVYIDANDAAGTGLTIAVGASGGVHIDGGLTDIGTGTCGVADGDNDLCVAAVLEVDGEAEFDGVIDADSTSDFADTMTLSKGSGNALVISAGGTISLAATSDIDASGYVAVGNGTPDGSVTAGTDEQLYVEGAVEIDGELELDGVLDADSTSDFADTATFSKGSGNAISVSAGGTLALAATADISALGYVNVGNGTPNGSVTGGTDEQLYVEGAFEVDGEAEFDGAIDADSTADIADTLTLSKGSGNALSVSAGGSVAVASGDVTISADSTNGNAGVRNEYIGLPRIRMKGLGQGTNATTAPTLGLDDDSPSGEFVASDADVTVADDATYYQEGAASLKVTFSTAADEGDGAHDAVGATDFTDDESVGFWFMADRTLTAGDVVFDMTDDGGSQKVNLPAYATANTWVWVELNIGGIANGDKDSITDFSFELSAAGALVAGSAEFSVYLDAIYKWDSADEDAIGAAVLTHGVLGVVDTENGDDLELYTEYFVHYESGNDFIVWITDESASDVVVLYAY